MMREIGIDDNALINAAQRVKEAREAKTNADVEYERALLELKESLEAHNGLKNLLLIKDEEETK